MTLDEARRFAKVMATADGGSCSVCADNLCSEANDEFPEFNWKVRWDEDHVVIDVSER